MDYLKVWTSFREVISPLNDAEKGRLFDAMLLYAECGEESELKGNERYIWLAAKQDIDRAVKKAETLRQNGSMGGRPPKANETKENLTKPDETKENQTKAYKVNIKKSKNKENINIAFESFWVAYPRHTNKQAALKVFQRLNPDDELMQTILNAIAVQRRSDQWTRDGGQYIPHPATWLNGRRWEDEMPKGGKTVNAQRYDQRDYTEQELIAVSGDLIEEARRARA